MDNRRCFFCGRTQFLENHHIFGGANRKKSDKYGLVVPLCHWCHNEYPNGVHQNKSRALALKKYGQKKIMIEEGWSTDDFIREFGKNYLD